MNMVETRGRRDPRDLESFESFLEEEGIREEVTAVAIKRVIALALREAMESQNLTKAAMAQKMDTSRAQLDRVLDPDTDSVTLLTLLKAAKSVGKTLRVELV